MIVVPTEGSVVLHFGRTSSETVGQILTLLALGTVCMWGYRLLKARKADGGPPQASMTDAPLSD
jgi:hypothetical protein